jgi:Flp pilus assembly protein TadG
VAATEFALCLPLLFLLLAGIWEVGRIMEIQAVAHNAAREAARDASLAVDNLDTIASNTIIYLQAAEPQAFSYGHATSVGASQVSLPTATAGRTVTDTAAGHELFTITFSDLTNTTLNPMDPSGASKLDVYQIGLQIPYSTIALSPLAQITGATRLNTTVTWVSMRDTPFNVNEVLPAQ